MAKKAKKSATNPAEYCRSEVLEGTMISIDPSSGKSGVAGWARFDSGFLLDHGVITIPYSNAPYKRFQGLRKKCMSDFEGIEFDVFLVELLKGRGRNYVVKPVLQQASAVIAASLDWDKCTYISPVSWQAIAKRLGGWIKRDDVDAVYQGYALIAFANGYKSTWKKEAQLAFLEELATEYNWKRSFEDDSSSDNQESDQG